MCRGLWASVFLFLFGLHAVAAQDTDSADSPAEPQTTEPRAEESLEEALPGFIDQMVVLDINARVLEQSKTEIWHESHKRATIPGRPVGIKLVGANVVVAAQFIPYLRRSGQNVLVAQGQIWVEIPEHGIRYQTTMQTIPIEFDEPIYFFPLGSSDREGEASIEIMLTMRPYRDHDAVEASTPVSSEQDGQETNNLP